MNFRNSQGLDYKDVLLVPKYSDIESRSSIDISSNLFGQLNIRVPIVAANMDSIINVTVAEQLSINGAMGILHRYQSKEDTIECLKYLRSKDSIAIPSIGVGNDQVELSKQYLEYNIDGLCIDIAHGDSFLMYETIEALRKFTDVNIIAGNIATREAALTLCEAGADAVKVGIGPGFVCTTRNQTGAGYPQLSAIIEIADALKNTNISIIADGGARATGDIVKALAAGADLVMSGYLFAGSQESGKETYRGMASLEAQQNFKGFAKNIEGRSTNIETRGPIKDIIQNIKEGIQSGFSYTGAHNIKELRANAEFVILK